MVEAARCGQQGGMPKPTLDDIRTHCAKYKYEDLDPEAFFNYYEREGWSKIRNWKASARLWNLDRKHRPMGNVVSMDAYLKRSKRI